MSQDMGRGEIFTDMETVDYSPTVQEKKTNYVVITTEVSACYPIV